jgi:hypothetical protein
MNLKLKDSKTNMETKEEAKYEDFNSLIEREEDEESLVFNIPYKADDSSSIRLNLCIYLFNYYFFYYLIIFLLLCLLRLPNRRRIVLYAHGEKPDVLCPVQEFKQPMEFIYFTLSLSMWDVDDTSKSIKVYVKVYFCFYLFLIYHIYVYILFVLFIN